MKENKNFELRSATRAGPATHKRLLATTVDIIMSSGTQRHGFIRFSDNLVKAVGKALPRGVSEQDPAYLQVRLFPGRCEVWALYARGVTGVKMWELEGIPPWLKISIR